jgi:hypothetical protein
VHATILGDLIEEAERDKHDDDDAAAAKQVNDKDDGGDVSSSASFPVDPAGWDGNKIIGSSGANAAHLPVLFARSGNGRGERGDPVRASALPGPSPAVPGVRNAFVKGCK